MPKFSDTAPTAVGKYLNAEARHKIAGQPLTITSASYDEHHRYNGKDQPRWVIGVTAPDGEKYAITFGQSDVRAARFGRLADMLNAGETIDPVILTEVTPEHGNRYWTFVDYEAPAADEPTTKTK